MEFGPVGPSRLVPSQQAVPALAGPVVSHEGDPHFAGSAGSGPNRPGLDGDPEARDKGTGGLDSAVGHQRAAGPLAPRGGAGDPLHEPSFGGDQRCPVDDAVAEFPVLEGGRRVDASDGARAHAGGEVDERRRVVLVRDMDGVELLQRHVAQQAGHQALPQQPVPPRVPEAPLRRRDPCAERLDVPGHVEVDVDRLDEVAPRRSRLELLRERPHAQNLGAQEQHPRPAGIHPPWPAGALDVLEAMDDQGVHSRPMQRPWISLPRSYRAVSRRLQVDCAMSSPRRPEPEVPSLFGDSPIDRAMDRVPPAQAPEALRHLGARLPAPIHLGTSSWAYPGWRGLVFAPRAPLASLARDGLAAYAAWPVVRTVGLDRAFYASPTADEYRRLRELVPRGFRFTVKAEQRCVRPDLGPDGTTFGSTTAHRGGGIANPSFLDPAFAVERVLRPAIEGLGDRLGPVVFQFPPIDLASRGPLGGAAGFLSRLRAFLAAVRASMPAESGVTLAVEVRNREFFSPSVAAHYADCLSAGDAVHSHLAHPTVPAISFQRQALEGRMPARGAIVVRWMLRRDLSYEGAAAAFEPYDALQAPDPATRAEIASLLAAASADRPAFVVCNNKAEGCAALSIRALAEEVVAAGTDTIARQGADPR
ncbi:MAG: DUF72 domain-containing protein [Phycisphaerales bacterium]|nr:DUF72 domain-containing protein [Phycisphaerales bacterium]